MDKEFLKKCWKNPRWHSLIVLIIWIVSLSILVGIVSIMNGINPQEKKEIPKKQEENKISYQEKLEHIISDEELLSFLVTTKDNSLKLEGTENGGVVNGYKEDRNGIKKYRIENGISYEVVLDEVKKIEGLYNEITQEFLDRNILISLLLETEEENSIEQEDTTTHEYNLIYKEKNSKISVIETKESIEKIIIEEENVEYQLVFSENKNE